ncbi:MAG: hypothetical protein CO003_01665 [Candidatus Portnoybacteria bacterium CG_4_8_14_3_um_filter_44_15]|uniref:7 transmembrane helices usually fused to an inactive transglutaminase domain-containing protein n=4 Tax=Candidatus Portnoyibacteriota TaxID=1817913 RepID=A0A2M7YLW1_9BACT|nr:MAG: hypothetical protein AUJ11_01175 [Parcubacteria group bacterium CG1_02_44_65]PIP15753.1 MAG: hypothetical protein COX45_01300 [Candidatus Portnoybacteria bacterium CG23_combo_of_CG06-09_8_20_14_all_44_36]PIW74637.1 MAG: hypothetical protein CO003_01665 [Candidatus Portnoybacteria bacterium CG_4_8_14_3_um_filter_44_15]PIZ70190.1 MAG: hypothetical protein COY10_00160 [Candidatus Portnoybacteria bacterium CG_4_10_14_0_2_um_filter_43_36]PJA63959.1 MAG: hypothetical protein CO160_01155 [Cand
MFFPIQYLINHGIPQETISLLLMIPIIATIIALSRQVIGIKGFGIYTPLIISFAFLSTGLKFGLMLFLAILLVGTLSRLVVKKLRLLYLPRMAIIVIIVTLTVIGAMYLGIYANRTEVITTSIFAILIMITLIEKFIAAQIEQGARGAIILTSETLILSIISFWVVNWSWLQDVVVQYPVWIIIFSLLTNLLLGRWTGLRLFEYYRFREVIKNVELPKKK